jgi:hypothetical protein
MREHEHDMDFDRLTPSPDRIASRLPTEKLIEDGDGEEKAILLIGA